MQKEHYPDQKIATTIEPVGKWWDAEDCALGSLSTSSSRCGLTTFSGSQTTRSVRRILWLSRQQLILFVRNTDLTNNPSGYECPSVRFPVLSSLGTIARGLTSLSPCRLQHLLHW